MPVGRAGWESFPNEYCESRDPSRKAGSEWSSVSRAFKWMMGVVGDKGGKDSFGDIVVLEKRNIR